MPPSSLDHRERNGDGGRTSLTAHSAGAPALAVTKTATSRGLDTFSANGRIQPHGRPTSYYFEHGTTTAYGSRTPSAPLPPRLAAYYHESFDSLAGWQAGLGGASLVHVPSGGTAGGFVRYLAPGDLDVAHSDGIGPNELVGYMYQSEWNGDADSAAFAGGDPDLSLVTRTATSSTCSSSSTT